MLGGIVFQEAHDRELESKPVRFSTKNFDARQEPGKRALLGVYWSGSLKRAMGDNVPEISIKYVLAALEIGYCAGATKMLNHVSRELRQATDGVINTTREQFTLESVSIQQHTTT